jgi:metal-responsive CopG/Arc/MetJ family transcriptional regulator
MAKKKAASNTRVEGAKSDQRIPFTMTEDELKDFDSARAKRYPLATRSTVIRELISNFVKETK